MFVIPARNAAVAAILRRGPSDWYHVVHWDTLYDQISHGAWIKGRIYEEKCDISTDGKLLIYSVLQGSRANTQFTHAWTAVSRLPWLHALIVWPQGTTYGGGGQFTGPKTIWGVSASGTHPEYPLYGLQISHSPPIPSRIHGIVKDADWSGFDHEGRLILTRGDLLFRRDDADNARETLIADFSELKPDPKPAPDWAKAPI